MSNQERQGSEEMKITGNISNAKRQRVIVVREGTQKVRGEAYGVRDRVGLGESIASYLVTSTFAPKPTSRLTSHGTSEVTVSKSSITFTHHPLST